MGTIEGKEVTPGTLLVDDGRRLRLAVVDKVMTSRARITLVDDNGKAISKPGEVYITLDHGFRHGGEETSGSQAPDGAISWRPTTPGGVKAIRARRAEWAAAKDAEQAEKERVRRDREERLKNKAHEMILAANELLLPGPFGVRCFLMKTERHGTVQLFVKVQPAGADAVFFNGLPWVAHATYACEENRTSSFSSMSGVRAKTAEEALLLCVAHSGFVRDEVEG